MGDILGKFAVIVFGFWLIFYIPITIVAVKQDNIAQTYIDNAVMEFVDDSRASARITPEAYEKMVMKVYAAHSPCEIQIVHMASYAVPDHSAPTGFSMKREYYTKDTILSYLDSQDYELKNGDYLKVTVENETPTLGGRLLHMILINYNSKSLFSSYGGYVGNNMQ